MIADFNDFCLYMYVLVDDFWQEVGKQVKHRRQQPQCSDSELLTLVLVSEYMGWDVETEALQQWQFHRDLFPILPSATRYNRRRRAMTEILKLLRQRLLAQWDQAHELDCALDSLPIAVTQFYHAPSASADWQCHGASFGKVASKKQTIYGYRLQVLLTLRGIIVDFLLAPAHLKDSQVAAEFLTAHPYRRVSADKGYINAQVALELRQHYGVILLTPTRRNQKRQQSPLVVAHIQRFRQICETVNSQLVQQLRIQRNHARSFAGLCARLVAKLTVHTCCMYLNHLLGAANPLPIKGLVFSN